MPSNDKSKGLQKYHHITDGTVTASKALVVDSNKDLNGIRNLTVTGTITGNVTGNVTGNIIGNIEVKSGGTFNGDTGTVTATGSGTSSSATLNKMAGSVTTPTMTSAAGASHSLVLTNSTVVATDFVLANIATTSTAGIPILNTALASSGSIVFNIKNVHASTAFDSPLTISFLVIKA